MQFTPRPINHQGRRRSFETADGDQRFLHHELVDECLVTAARQE